MVRASITVSEIKARYKLMADRMADVRLDLPMAYAMLFRAVYALVQLRQNRADIRDKVDVALTLAGPVAMPSGDEIARLLREVHDRDRER